MTWERGIDMAIELDKHGLRSYELRKKRLKRQLVRIGILLSFFLIVAGVFIIKHLLTKNYTAYEVMHTIERQDSISARYISYGTGTMRYSRDGAMAFSSNGAMLWNGTYEMKDPIVDICDTYVAIADRGSKQIQIYNEKGSVTNISVLHNIKKVSIAAQGVVAVLLEGDGVDYIELYQEDGKQVVATRTVNEKNGYPIDIALSDDGKKLVTSYISFYDGALQSNIAFFNFGKVGENYTDKVVGGYDFVQTIFPQVEFVNSEIVCAFGDNKIAVYKIKEIPSSVFEQTFESEIKSIMYSTKYIGVILNNYEGEEKHRILIYDLSGNLVLEEDRNLDYTSISISGEDIIMMNSTTMSILTIKGKKKFEHTFDKNISHVFPVNNKDKYILIDDTHMAEIKLIEE